MRIAFRYAVGRCAVLVAAALLAAGCGHGTRSAFRPATGASAFPAVSGDASPTPRPEATATRPAGGRTAAPAPTRAPTTSTRPPLSRPPLTLTLSGPMPPLSSGQITALYQNLCGDPSRGLVVIDVADPARISTVWYEYHVRTPVPFDGVNRSLSVTGDFASWRGMIGPFDADARNAAGGPIVVTAHGEYKDGSQRSVSATWTLKPCQR